MLLHQHFVAEYPAGLADTSVPFGTYFERLGFDADIAGVLLQAGKVEAHELALRQDGAVLVILRGNFLPVNVVVRYIAGHLLGREYPRQREIEEVGVDVVNVLRAVQVDDDVHIVALES